MKKRVLKIALCVVFCWVIFVAVEGVRLIGSTDPGKTPLFYIGGTQYAGEYAEYNSLGFTVDYHLTVGDMFVSGEFRVLGIPIASWGKEGTDQGMVIDTDQYAGLLMEYRQGDRCFTRVFNRSEINYFNTLILTPTAPPSAEAPWIFKFAASSKMQNMDKESPSREDVIPNDAETLEILFFENYFQINGITYEGTPKLITFLHGRFASDLPS